jgi:hypothetical protein
MSALSLSGEVLSWFTQDLSIAFSRSSSLQILNLSKLTKPFWSWASSELRYTSTKRLTNVTKTSICKHTGTKYFLEIVSTCAVVLFASSNETKLFGFGGD